MKLVSDTVRDDIRHYCGDTMLDARFYLRFLFTLSLHVILLYQLSHLLHRSRSPLRFLNYPLKYLIQLLSGCQLEFSATIGRRLHMAHPTGIVIGSGVIIGDDVTLYQHVTLGGKSRQDPEYPLLANGVTVYAGATILGRLTVGEGATVGAGTLLFSDVPPGATVFGVPGEVR